MMHVMPAAASIEGIKVESGVMFDGFLYEGSIDIITGKEPPLSGYPTEKYGRYGLSEPVI